MKLTKCAFAAAAFTAALTSSADAQPAMATNGGAANGGGQRVRGSDGSPPPPATGTATDEAVTADRNSAADTKDYIVIFKKDEKIKDPEANANSLVDTISGRGSVKHVYKHVLTGFAARRLTPQAAEALRKNPNVEAVYEDGVVTISAATQQLNPPSWGLSRIDQRGLPLDYSYDYDFTGDGVHAYVIDTGIRETHDDFIGRVGNGIDFIDYDLTPQDCRGHGTHVASTLGGTAHGVAKGVTLHGVRVLDCEGRGTFSDVIEGMDWVLGQHNAADPPQRSVANMSVGGGFYQLVNDAVANMVAAGIVVVVSGGNDSEPPEYYDACLNSPGSADKAITVGSTFFNDERSSFSNIGDCLDLFAPGSYITAAWNTSDSDTETISGTSMASPHVAGVAALILEEYPLFTPDQVRTAMLDVAVAGAVTDPGAGSPNLLLQTIFDSSPATSPATTPIGSATAIKYYNAAANGYTDPTKLIGVSDVDEFCDSQGGQHICDFADVCPIGVGSTLPGDPKCGATLDYIEGQYLMTSLTGCPGTANVADVFWSDSSDTHPYLCSQLTVNCYESSAYERYWYEVFACCSEVSSNTVTASCGGDPHFRDYSGNPFNFHGECDLVLAHLPNFHGKPLDLHIRTRLQGFYSIVEAVGIKHGNFVYEFNNEVIGEPKQYFNGAEIESLPHEEGPFAITTTTKKNEDYDVNVLIITIHLAGSQDKIILHQAHQWVFVDIEASSTELSGATGLFGSFPGSKKMGRDGTDLTDMDRNTYGAQWQVQAEEPQLFHATPEGHPMAPHATCKLPEVDAHEYLRAENAEFYRIAVEACMKEGMMGMDLDDCVFDVAVLKSPAIAAAWWGSKQVEDE